MWSSSDEDDEGEASAHNANFSKPYKPLFIVIVDMVAAITFMFEVLKFYHSMIKSSDSTMKVLINH